MLKLLAGETVRPALVLLRHAPSLPERRYRDWFGCEVRFGETINALLIHADVLAQQIDPTQPGLVRMAQSYVESIIGQRPMSLADQVGILVERLLGVVFCRSRPRSLMVKSVGNDWSGRMQMGGQVSAIIHLKLFGPGV